MNSDQTPSDNTAPDKALEFRRCWTLGEAYYFLENSYEDCFKCKIGKNPDSKDIREYKSNLTSIKSICGELGINDLDMYTFIDDLHRKLNSISKDSIQVYNKHEGPIYKEYEGKDFGDYFEIKLEGYITGNLKGKDPRYNHIFRTAKHALELYKIKNPEKEKNDRKIRLIKSDLESIKNFVSNDKITLIHEILNNWRKVCKNYDKYKMNPENKNNSKSYENERYPPHLIEIVSRIGGLVTGSIGKHDVLNRRDHTTLNVINYLPLMGTVALILGIVWNSNFDFSFLYQLISPKEQLDVYLTGLSALVGAFLAIVKFTTPIWEKFVDWCELKIAIIRLKNPDQCLVTPLNLSEKYENMKKDFLLGARSK